MGVLRMGVLVTGCPKKNPYDSHSPKLVPKLITGVRERKNGSSELYIFYTYENRDILSVFHATC